MINENQLEILQDMFSQCDDEWLMNHVSIKVLGSNRDVSIYIDNINCQDYDELRQEQQ